MQPYLFPYLGYLQLLAACDRFVAYDDAKFTKNSWVNRNRILEGGAARWFTLPVARGSHLAPINGREYHLARGHQHALLERIRCAYGRAPRFAATFELVRRVLAFADPNVAAFNIHALRSLADALGIATPIIASSELPSNPALKGLERVLDICTRIGAETYVNSIGGLALYDPSAFAARGMRLRFLQTRAQAYRQFDAPFVPALSIIDVLMFNDPEVVRSMLGQYRLIEAGSPGETEARAFDA